jgi:ribosomal protein S12 methylthiotransferase
MAGVVLTVLVCCSLPALQQHINNLTLLAMNRPPQAHTKGLLQKLRDNIPGLCLRTTFISGGDQGRNCSADACQ